MKVLGWMTMVTVCLGMYAGAEHKVVESDAEQKTEVRNPFAYQRSEQKRGLVPATGANMPHGIRLAGLLIPEEGDAIAVLRLPGDETPAYVREGDLLTIDTEAESPFYLLVKNISGTGVEVAPRIRPGEVHLIR